MPEHSQAAGLHRHVYWEALVCSCRTEKLVTLLLLCILNKRPTFPCQQSWIVLYSPLTRGFHLVELQRNDMLGSSLLYICWRNKWKFYNKKAYNTLISRYKTWSSPWNLKLRLHKFTHDDSWNSIEVTLYKICIPGWGELLRFTISSKSSHEKSPTSYTSFLLSCTFANNQTIADPIHLLN